MSKGGILSTLNAPAATVQLPKYWREVGMNDDIPSHKTRWWTVVRGKPWRELEESGVKSKGKRSLLPGVTSEISINQSDVNLLGIIIHTGVRVNTRRRYAPSKRGEGKQTRT